ncbi:hypothetical protein ACFLRF_05890 [Candidatus Altiarchaeota archaeon]
MPRRDGTGPFYGPARGGKGRMMGGGPGGPSMCVCPSCGYGINHVRGQPCNTMACPKCGMRLARK